MSNVTITGMSIPNTQIPLGSNKTGTCGVTNNSPIVTFATALGRVYRNKGGFLIKLNTIIHYVSHVAEDGLSLTLTSDYVGITDAAATYIIYPCLELRFYCDTAFQPRGASYVVQASAIGSTAFFKSVLVSQYDAGTGDLLWIPELILPATGDIASPPQQKAKYHPVFYTLTGSQVAYLSGFERGLKVPETPSTTNWPDLLVANQTQPFNFINETSTLSSDQVLALISSAGAIDGTHRTLLMAASGGVAAEDSALSQDVSGNLTTANNLNLGGSIEVVDDATIGGSLEAADAAITGAVTAASATLSGALTANSAAVTGAVTAASATLSGALNSNTAAITGALTAASATLSGALSSDSAAITGAVTAASATLSGALSSASAAVSGAVTAGSATVTNALTVGTTATVAGETDLVGGFKTRTAAQIAALTAGSYGRLTWQTDGLKGLKQDYGASVGIRHAQPFYSAYELGFIPTLSDSTTRTANSTTWAAVITALTAAGATIQFPEGTFYFATELTTTKPILLVGAGMVFNPAGSQIGTQLIVESGQNGIELLTGAAGSVIRDLSLATRSGFSGTTGDGIYSEVQFYAENVHVTGFSRHGVYVYGTAPANADHSSLRNVHSYANKANNFHLNGGDDTNVITLVGCNSTNAGAHGFYNAGNTNTFIGCHASNSAVVTAGSKDYYEAGSSSFYLLPYSESGASSTLYIADTATHITAELPLFGGAALEFQSAGAAASNHRFYKAGKFNQIRVGLRDFGQFNSGHTYALTSGDFDAAGELYLFDEDDSSERVIRYIPSTRQFIVNKLAFRGTLTSSGTPQSLSGSGALGAVNLTTDTTYVTTSGAATSTLAAGAEGQRKRILFISDGGDCVITVTNLLGGTTVTLNDADDFIQLEYINSKWRPIVNIGCTIA